MCCKNIFCVFLFCSKAGISDIFEGNYGTATGIDTHSAVGLIDFSYLFLTSSFDWTFKLWSHKVSQRWYIVTTTAIGWSNFIKSIFKSLVILAMWLALSCAIYSRIALSFALNRIFFSANENGTVQQNLFRFQGFVKLNKHITGQWETKKPLFGKCGY